MSLIIILADIARCPQDQVDRQTMSYIACLVVAVIIMGTAFWRANARFNDSSELGSMVAPIIIGLILSALALYGIRMFAGQFCGTPL